MSNRRSWAWDHSVTEEDQAVRTSAVERLAARWNDLHNAQEERGFRRQAAAENPWEDDEPFFDSEEEAESYNIQQRVNRQLEQDEIDSVERQLHELGARMMRPYEHWNEDERLMEYMERDRY